MVTETDSKRSSRTIVCSLFAIYTCNFIFMESLKLIGSIYLNLTRDNFMIYMMFPINFLGSLATTGEFKITPLAQ